MSMKNPLTLVGIEPATFRFVAQHLNHCATAVPMCVLYTFELLILFALSDIFEEEVNMLIITINLIAEDLLISNIYIYICVCVCVCVYILAILKLLKAFLSIILFNTSYVIQRSTQCFSNTAVQLRAKHENYIRLPNESAFQYTYKYCLYV